MLCPSLHHKGERNAFVVARQIIMKETVTTESSIATAAKRKATLPVYAEIKKSDQKHTQEKQETRIKPRRQFEKAKREKIHKVGANTTDSERDTSSDSDSELTLHMVSGVFNPCMVFGSVGPVFNF